MSISRFFPEDFQPHSNITILAGRGDYPVICAKNITQAGLDPCVIMLDEEIDEADFPMIDPSKLIRLEIGKIGKLFKTVKNIGTEYIIMAGQIQPKKLFNGLKPDLTAIMLLAKLKERNAEKIFGAIAKELQNLGIQILDSRSFMDADIASSGFMTHNKIMLKQEYIDHGIFIAKEIARLDIGQSVIVKNGTVLCVEDYDGTNKMIKRASDFNIENAIFIKTSKPKQDFRFDVPVFGVTTIELLHSVGIKHVTLEANSVIMLNKQELLKKATQYGISIYGF